MIDGTVLIRGGRVVDPVNELDGVADVLVREGVIERVGRLDPVAGVEEFDAAGLLVTPGWIDVHVHLRDPGFPEKETMETGTAAAAAGGFTAIACMPNTKPALDTPEIIAALLERARTAGSVRVYPIATITRGRAGGEAVDFDAVIAAGAIGWSDDGDTAANSAIMREALEASVRLDRPVIVHCEDKALASGAMHEGDVSRELGIPGIPAAAEEIIISRDLMLAELTGGWLHVCHVSTGRGIELIADAWRRGVHVTAEVMPHHLAMSDEWVAGSRTLHNTNVPGGCARPVRAIRTPRSTRRCGRWRIPRRCWKRSRPTISIASAPTTRRMRSRRRAGRPSRHAAFGLSGLEFAFPLTYALVEAGHLIAGRPGAALDGGAREDPPRGERDALARRASRRDRVRSGAGMDRDAG